MKARFECLLLAGAILLVPAVSGAQTPTPYSTPQFSATFNGPVTAQPPARTSTTNNSVDLFYSSEVNGVEQIVAIRTMDGPAYTTADFSSSDFYAQQIAATGTLEDSSQGRYQGYPFSYTKALMTQQDGSKMVQRDRFIILGDRTMAFVRMTAPRDRDGDAVWETFANSLVFK
ncbi:MAG: hypothetical protein ABSC62_11870 [Terracidiphilus sp.]|jgi:hypothetical protein